MVRIENINITKNNVSFDYFPEDKNIKHFLKYDKSTKELLEHKKSDEYKSDVYAKHAYRAVENVISKNRDIPKSFVVGWY